ncbi:MarR family winged helix-turn-helix transcriptional regulator [Bowmanella dokdonensis]|uniref:MarR family transcriptional regulator n=1 Tax=Bowmanella dokdonensis TaxID=751969 RepID=A0A939IQS2_9ALTE|nr:MarR family transcriptional regulator [Bowmanella dokdonensis]MBN7827235.1 MarR family transcriptional regulator [Bowmanella dokdonensis]
MTEDFLDELAELALGSRLKRLAERMLADASAIYAAYGADLQPRWFTLLALLYHKGEVSVVEAAEYLGLSQPAISQFCTQLSARKLVRQTPCKKDSRRRLITLTQQGRSQVEAIQPMWQAVREAARELCEQGGNDFYQSLRQCEQAFGQKSLYQRTMERKDDPQ